MLVRAKMFRMSSSTMSTRRPARLEHCVDGLAQPRRSIHDEGNLPHAPNVAEGFQLCLLRPRAEDETIGATGAEPVGRGGDGGHRDDVDVVRGEQLDELVPRRIFWMNENEILP